MELLQPLVEDARELEELALGAYSDIEGAGRTLGGAGAISLYMGVIRMPTMLFERLAARLRGVDRALQEGRSSAPGVREPRGRATRQPVDGTPRFGFPLAPRTVGI